MHTSPSLLRTPLYDLHQSLGARMVPFAGYEMPVQYPQGLLQEHLHTRNAAGWFDVSHMGQIRVTGPHAAAALERALPCDALDLRIGQQRYSLLLNEQGGILDDLMLIRRTYDFLLIVNAAHKHDDLARLQHLIGNDCALCPLPDHALLALQGPQAVGVLSKLAPGVEKLVFLTGGCCTIHAAGRTMKVFLTRSGYTGEDGFELSVPADDATALAQALLEDPSVRPVGLGARNSLRLEAGLVLHGNDIDATTTPVEANLYWAISPVRRPGGARAGGFPGAEAIEERRTATATATATTTIRQRIGLIAMERTPVREPAPLYQPDGVAGQPSTGNTVAYQMEPPVGHKGEDHFLQQRGQPSTQQIGHVCSGLFSPTLGQPIAMGYVPHALAAVGTRLHAMVRGKPVAMEVCKLPFVPHRYVRRC
ncbi:glycine cleavage system aminomethyltransferase GcvT [Candidatus Symbiobacter mobilis]|uniref:aminomethyltransferase n=1 Tax=Candidatus Symbiobacter mobilis CR TaxID=946483 RepID=U5N9T3_9BURK|nr:glycine cleavage system aminomethyltransferase GcvT [Candidatus Symbiobacter mobilis]AGX88167.1 aminomethyltransferase [Candidatus Symbiobacter mobilis CR]